MKYETFERATELRHEINRLDDLASLIINATHQNNTLAALRPQATADLSYDGDRVMNEEVLDNDMRDAFLAIIRTKINELRNEFDSL
jgi:hypothetical protein